MLFHDVMKKLNDEDLRILASYFEGAKSSNKKDEDGKKIEETKDEFVTRFVKILFLSISKKEDSNWNIINDIIIKLPEADIKILIAFFLGCVSTESKSTKKEMIGTLITFIHDVLNSRVQKKGVSNVKKG